MNPSLLVTVGEGTVGGQFVFRWVKSLEFEAEGKHIFDFSFSLAQKIPISLAINSLHCFIIIGVVFFALVGSAVKEMVGYIVCSIISVFIVFGFIFIVFVVVIG